jgi:hypothetical protein
MKLLTKRDKVLNRAAASTESPQNLTTEIKAARLHHAGAKVV